MDRSLVGEAKIGNFHVTVVQNQGFEEVGLGGCAAPRPGCAAPRPAGLRVLGKDSPLSAGQTPLAFVWLEWRELQETRRSRFLTHVNRENDDWRVSKTWAAGCLRLIGLARARLRLAWLFLTRRGSLSLASTRLGRVSLSLVGRVLRGFGGSFQAWSPPYLAGKPLWLGFGLGCAGSRQTALILRNLDFG